MRVVATTHPSADHTPLSNLKLQRLPLLGRLGVKARALVEHSPAQPSDNDTITIVPTMARQRATNQQSTLVRSKQQRTHPPGCPYT